MACHRWPLECGHCWSGGVRSKGITLMLIGAKGEGILRLVSATSNRAIPGSSRCIAKGAAMAKHRGSRRVLTSATPLCSQSRCLCRCTSVPSSWAKVTCASRNNTKVFQSQKLAWERPFADAFLMCFSKMEWEATSGQRRACWPSPPRPSDAVGQN